MIITFIKRMLGIPSILDPFDPETNVPILKQIPSNVHCKTGVRCSVDVMVFLRNKPLKNLDRVRFSLNSMLGAPSTETTDDEFLRWFCRKFLVSLNSFSGASAVVWLLCNCVVVTDSLGNTYDTKLCIMRTRGKKWYICTLDQVKTSFDFLQFGYLIGENCVLRIMYKRQAMEHVIKPVLDKFLELANKEQ